MGLRFGAGFGGWVSGYGSMVSGYRRVVFKYLYLHFYLHFYHHYGYGRWLKPPHESRLDISIYTHVSFKYTFALAVQVRQLWALVVTVFSCRSSCFRHLHLRQVLTTPRLSGIAIWRPPLERNSSPALNGYVISLDPTATIASPSHRFYARRMSIMSPPSLFRRE